jgi:hypothetical protein
MKTPPLPPRAFFMADYDPAVNRWHWTITEHGRIIARSTTTYPTEHYANDAARTLARHLGVKW